MNIAVGAAQIGQWYTHLDKGEQFLVTGYDEKSGMIETQDLIGDLDEVDEETWNSLPLARAEPPEDWSEAMIDADESESADSMAPIERFLDSR